jgi:YesN/AraC family two-component response regulator
MEQRLFWGGECILDASKARRESDNSLLYSSSSERKLIDAIKLCHLKSIQRECAEWIKEISRGSRSQAIQYTNFLFLAVIREFESIIKWWDVDPNDLYATMNEIHHVETLGEIKKCLNDFCIRLVAIIEENKNKAAAMKNTKVIEELKAFILEHYADPGLSLELVSEQAQLTSGYIGKLFKSVTGSSFNDYVTMVRMEKAKVLLVETDDTVAQIGELVGIFNFSYFSTLFKKKYGMTPSQFREQSHQGNNKIEAIES